MTPLKQALKDYIDVRRSLGFQLRHPASLLRKFVEFLHAAGSPYITTSLALRWATQPSNAEPATWARRLGMVRQFAIWYSAIEPHTEIPSSSLLPSRRRRKPPYIYSDEEVAKILSRTQQLQSSKGFRARTFTTLFGLMVATGMRVNEVVGLDRSDVDLDGSVLHIRKTKFRKSRYVPIHATTAAALRKYARVRDRLFCAPSTPAFFISERWETDSLPNGALQLREGVAANRPARTGQISRSWSTAARFTTPICYAHLDPVVSRWPRCRTRAPQTEYVPGTCSCERYLLVSRSRA